MKNSTPITQDQIAEYSRAYSADATAQILTNAFSKTGMGNLAYNPVAAKKMQFRFSIDIKTMPATNQKSSGRCWLFAATNVLRERIAKQCNMDNFELSQSYLAFWDKFERCNYYFETIIDTAKLPADDRTVSYLVGTGVFDGGQWDMFVNIVRKYGIVPKDAMPETEQTSSTGNLNNHLNRYLKVVAIRLRKMIAEGADEAAIDAEKKTALAKIYRFLCMCYGEPPKEFDFEYTDKESKLHREPGYTPMTYYEKYVGTHLDDYVSIINAPTVDKPYDAVYTVKYLGNVVGANPILYLNLELEEFKSIVLQQLKDGEIVWFGSDCGKFGDGAAKSWDDASWNHEALTGFELTLNKADSLDYHESQMNHAMVITGVNIDEATGRPNRWKIENSWGSDGANGGYHMASDTWFDRYVYQAVVNKKYLGEKSKLLKKKPKVLDPWDPMGSLAD